MRNEGTFTTDGEGWILRFERDLNHPIEKVWSTLTENERLEDWMTEDGTIEPRVGGKVQFNDHDIESTIVTYEPPKVIEYGWRGKKWDGGTIRWELSPTGGGTRLVLTHQMNVMSDEAAEKFKQEFPELPEDWHPLSSTLAGWHTILDRLDAALDGSPIPMDMNHWRDLNESYKAFV